MPEQQAPIANWLIMMYIAADDVLCNFAVGSLKQLKRAANSNVVVAAQFDADGRRNIPLLVFDGSGDKNGSLKDDEKDQIARDTDMADPDVLRAFIDWACSQRKARHYALVLWGHGPELLFDDYPSAGSKTKPKFMSPSDLSKALANTKLIRGVPDKPRKFDVIGIDACNMCMLEAAYEIKDYTDFLVASQDEVPDFSFPYDTLLQAFGQTDQKSEIVDMCKKIPKGYTAAYGDYILTQDTRMESLTLASLSLDKVEKVTEPLTNLVNELLKGVDDPKKRDAIITARASSKGFVAGLYTDLYDFCEQLRSQMCAANLCDDALVKCCEAICAAIDLSGNDAYIIENQAPQDKHCHGLSIYFPYLTDAEKDLLAAPLAPMVKGGLDVLNKGGLDVLNKGGTDVLNAVRRQRVQDTEKYYDGLKLSLKTRWGKFIKEGWSRCLAQDAETKSRLEWFPQQDVSDILDDRYSAQQCALNLLSLYRDLSTEKPLPSPEVNKGKPHLPRGPNGHDASSPRV